MHELKIKIIVKLISMWRFYTRQKETRKWIIRSYFSSSPGTKRSFSSRHFEKNTHTPTWNTVSDFEVVVYMCFQLSVRSNRWIALVLVAVLRSMISFLKTRAIYSTNQMQNQKQTRPGAWRDLVARVFPRLAPVTCIFFEFSLVRFVVFVCCDGPL